MKYADIDRIYQKIPLDDISWNSGTPPDALAYLVPGGGAHLLTFCRPRYTVGEYPPREPRYITTALRCHSSRPWVRRDRQPVLSRRKETHGIRDTIYCMFMVFIALSSNGDLRVRIYIADLILDRIISNASIRSIENSKKIQGGASLPFNLGRPLRAA